MGDSLGDWYGCSMVLSACINYADYKVVEEELVPLFEELYEEYEGRGGHQMITMDTWPESWEAVPEWTEVSEEVYNHFLNVLPPLNWHGSYFQCSEPYSHQKDEHGRYRGKYLTFAQKDGKYWFLGIQFGGHYPTKGN